MSMLLCPECNKLVSQFAESCPNCGFPIKKFLDDHNITDPEKFLLCPKCAHGQTMQKFCVDPYVKCKYCGEIVVETEEDIKEMRQLYILKGKEKQYNERCIELAKQYGKFSQEAFDDAERQIVERHSSLNNSTPTTQPQNVPKCPTCGSTNISKIGTGERVMSVLGLGILSKKINKTWKCNNCGHTW